MPAIPETATPTVMATAEPIPTAEPTPTAEPEETPVPEIMGERVCNEDEYYRLFVCSDKEKSVSVNVDGMKNFGVDAYYLLTVRFEDGTYEQLIEKNGFKGYSVGGAQVSEKHAGFVVNRGGATYDDVVELMDHVRRKVYADSGVTLEPEIRIYPKGMLLVDDWRLRRRSIMEDMQTSAKGKLDGQNGD